MLLIADCGSSKTDWRVLQPGGSVLQARTPGFNPFYDAPETLTGAVSTHLRPLLAHPPQAIYFYGAGIAGAVQAATVATALRAVFPDTERIEAHSDMLGAARSLCGHTAGIACILGTGANTCYAEDGQIAHQVGTLGFWLGDEGSGADLGKTLLQRFLHGELPPELRERLQKRHPDLERLTVLEHAYRRPFPNRYFAAFSKFLFDNRRQPYVQALLQERFTLFFEKYVLKYPQAARVAVHFTGSVAFYYSDFLRKVAQQQGISLGHISETPIAGLTLFHEGEPAAK